MGNYQSKPTTAKVIRSNGPDSKLSWVSASMQGWRSTMEDADIAEDPFLPGGEGSALFGVFDGHGGSEVSQCLERYLARALRRLIEPPGEHNYEAILQKLYLDLDLSFSSPDGLAKLEKELYPKKEVVVEEGKEPVKESPFPHIMTAGSTAVVALLIDHTLYVANAGDSRAVLSRNGQAVHLTEDHKPNDPREAERIQKAGWSVSGGRVGGTLNLSRALGDYEFKQNKSINPEEYSVTAFPDVRTEALLDDQDEFLILACDGIFEKMTWDSVVAFVRGKIQCGLPLTKICSETLDECLAAMHGAPGCDNMTLQIVICPTTAGKQLVEEGLARSHTAPDPPLPENFDIITTHPSPFHTPPHSSTPVVSDDSSDQSSSSSQVVSDDSSDQSSSSSQVVSDDSSDQSSSSSSSQVVSDASSSSESSTTTNETPSASNVVEEEILIPSAQLLTNSDQTDGSTDPQ